MIIVKLKGGLGNQLFQYACGRHLALSRNVPLLIDISGYAAQTNRSYALEPYMLDTKVLNEIEVRNLLEPRATTRLLNRIISRPQPHWFKEKKFNYDPELHKETSSLILDGYWQSERYFLTIRTRLQYELSIHLVGVNAKCASDISTKTAVAVHIRRGDYLSNLAARATHGTCPAEYYREAAKVVEQGAGSVHYYLFGDDPEWARQALSFLQPSTIVDLNSPGEAHLDLELMRRCRHHIVANSTLSWWGAWLSDESEKIVVAPHQWFLDPKIDTEDLIPNSWCRI